MTTNVNDQDQQTETAQVPAVVLPALATTMDPTTRGEIDIQIVTAKRFPRSIRKFMEEAESLACLNDDIAASCFYKLKRNSRDEGSKVIEGPSVRFAEIISSCWGNMRIEGRTSHEDDRFVYGQGTSWDLERNVLIRYEVRRRIADRNGRRYSDDMISVTSNAASAIGLRNSVFRTIPKAFWEPILDKARKVAVGDAKSLAERRQKMLDYYTQKLGVSLERVLAYLEVEEIQKVTLQHVEDLRGLATALKEGDAKIDEVFPEPGTPGKGDTAGAALKTAAGKLDALVDKLQKPAAVATTEVVNKETGEVTEQPNLSAEQNAKLAEENAKLDAELAAQEGAAAERKAEPKREEKAQAQDRGGAGRARQSRLME